MIRLLLLFFYFKKGQFNSLKWLSIIACFLFFSTLSAQKGSYLVENYTAKEYQAGVSNWGISQDKRGILYFANLLGLLEYDGLEWRLIKINNGVNVRTLSIDKQNRIYISTQNDIGYMSVSALGELNFDSFKDTLFSNNSNTVIKIISTKNSTYYASRSGIFQQNKQGIGHWIIKNRSIKDIFLKGDTLVSISDNDSLHYIYENHITAQKAPFPEIKKALYKSTINQSYYLCSSKSGEVLIIDSIGTSTQLKLPDNFSTIVVDSTNLDWLPTQVVLGSRNQGIIAINKDNTTYSAINKDNGLRKNSLVVDLEYDSNGNLWVAQLDGISKIWNPTILHWNQSLFNDEYILDIVKAEGKLMIATTGGLYTYSNDTILKTPNFKDRIWSVMSTEHGVYTAGDNGIFKLVNNELQAIYKTISSSGLFLFNEKLIINTLESGLGSLDLSSNEFTIINESISGDNLSTVQLGNEIWISSQYKGVFHIDAQNNFKSKLLNEAHGLPGINRIEIIEHNNQPIFATNNGFYKINKNHLPDSSNYFIPDSSLFEERVKISCLQKDLDNNIWFITTDSKDESYVKKLIVNKKGNYQLVEKPFRKLPSQSYTKIYPDPDEDGFIWIAGTEGLYRYNDNLNIDYDIPFNTLIRRVQTGDSLIFGGTFFDPLDTSIVRSILVDQPKEFKPRLTYDYNELSFQFTATSYEIPEKNMYSYYLKGYDESWSEWNTSNKKEYTNLSPGTYIFNVKSKNIYDNIGRTATYEFTILPPWYMTKLAYISFAFFGVLGFVGAIRLYTYRLRLQRQKLKLIIADRTYEVLQQKKEIENQHNRLLEQTEEIKQQRDDIKEKNQELESSQEEILAINQQLHELNNHLEKKVEERTLEIKSTLEQLQKTNKELDTFIYRASHDLKSPISRIMGLTSLARLELPDNGTKEYMELIDLAATEMKNLLAKLTNLHELLNKKPSTSEIDIPSLLGEIREKLKHLDRDNNTKYSFKIKESLTIKTDEDIIKVIIENLLENALIFKNNRIGEQHHIQFSIFESEGKTNIQILDNGVGISSDHHNKLFDMFYRASDQSKGTGLGLYLVKMAVDKLEGSIKLNSEPGKYTEFTISIPIKP